MNCWNKSWNTPLHVACRQGNLDIVRFLAIERRCEVNIQNKNRETPLHIACDRGHFGIFKVLVVERHCKMNWLLTE